MKKLHQFFNHGITCLLSLSFIITIITGCSQESKNQDAQETAQEETVPQQSVQEEITTNQEIQEDTEVSNNQPAQTTQPAPASREPNKTALNATSLSYKDMDADNNDILDKDEFYGGFYNAWDENGDNTINENEFNTAAQNFFAKNDFNEYGTFGDWDADSNNEISDQEFRKVMASIVDIDKNERLAQNLLIIWDLDNDDKVEKVELDNITVMLDEDDN